MQPENKPEFRFSSEQTIRFLLKWWIQVLVVTFASAIIAAGASFLIKNKFKSTVIFYPTTTNSISSALLAFGDVRKDFLEFGDENEAEQALQILQSDDIRNHIISKFDLYAHYDIDPNGQYARTKMFKKYSKNVTSRRTEYNSVEISVLDTDPQMAADIANEVARKLDETKTVIQRKQAVEGLKIVEERYKELQKDLGTLTDSLNKIRVLGVNEPAAQSEMYYEQYAIALSKGNAKAALAIEEKINIISQYASSYYVISNQIALLNEQFAGMKLKYEEARVDAEKSIPHIMVVNYATPADRKTYPKRSYIVVGAAFATFCMTIFFLIGLENLRRYREKLAIDKPEGTEA